jgi:excisionase family DNA binding protein
MPKTGDNVKMLTEHFGEQVYGVPEACDFLAVSKRTLANYVKEGKIKGFLFRSVRFFKESEIREFLNNQLNSIEL